MPAAHGSNTVRTLYFFVGSELKIAERAFSSHAGIEVDAKAELRLEAGADPVEILVLQGRPIGQPVVQHGPFVMNTREQIQRAMSDYRQTQFGGWPWPSDDPVHAKDAGRFARHADGRTEFLDQQDAKTP
jgi:redox-sensitive bicupin YhaK (pirin superfamily)